MSLVIMFLLVSVSVVLLTAKRSTVFEYEKALQYTNGKFVKILEPGQHILFWPHITIVKVDVRSKCVSIPGQEILSSDGVPIKISLVAEYVINAPHLAINNVEDYHVALYTTLQLVLRDIVSLIEVETIMISRDEINKLLLEKAYEKVLSMGLKLNNVGVKDIMFSGEVKKMFSQVVQARKESLAALEKARGDSAVLRHMANVSKVIESNPGLMKLKLLESSGNTFVMGWSDQLGPIIKG